MKQFTFYKLYSDILEGMNDTDAGKFAMRICEYEFEDKQPKDELSDKERFYWNNIADMLAEVKEAEREGKLIKRYNLRSEHFTFYETYFDAMKLMKGNNLGAFVKAICAYMLQSEEPRFKDKTIQGYFNLCKRKMDISKKRKSNGSKGGKTKSVENNIAVNQVQETDKQSVARDVSPLKADSVIKEKLSYEQFRRTYPDIQGSLYGVSERYRTDIDWRDVAAKRATDEELKKERNIFHLVRKYEQKYM